MQGFHQFLWQGLRGAGDAVSGYRRPTGGNRGSDVREGWGNQNDVAAVSGSLFRERPMNRGESLKGVTGNLKRI